LSRKTESSVDNFCRDINLDLQFQEKLFQLPVDIIPDGSPSSTREKIVEDDNLLDEQRTYFRTLK